MTKVTGHIVALLWILLLLPGFASGQWTQLNAFDNAEIQSHAEDNLAFSDVMLFLLEHDVTMHRVSYEMPFLGNDIPVSGALFVPDAPETAFPVLVYHHGTTFKRQSAPSFKVDLTNLGYVMASLGFVVLMPDYVGLGESELQHPYCHAQSESDAGWQLVQSLVELSWELDVQLDGNLYVTGYSQGGHGAMAMARSTMPVNLQGELSLEALAPLSGPYDLSGTQLPWILDSPNYSQPAYIFYILKGWNAVYGNLYGSMSEVCMEPYASMLDSLLDGEHSGEEINAICPDDWTTMLMPGVLEGMTGEGSALLEAALDNDVHTWVPPFPLHMRYCTEDEEVLYENATSAFESMSGAGANDIQAFDLGEYSHNECAMSAISGAVLWFMSLNAQANSITSVMGSQPCDEWEVFDVMGRRVVIQDGESLKVLFKRCVQNGQVTKWMKVQ